MCVAKGRGFGFWTLTFLVIANMVGAGVFTTSGFTLESLGDPWFVMLAWLVAGIIALCGAFSYGLLVKQMPVSGGEYAFLSSSGFPFVGFVAGWVSLLAGFSGAIAYAALALEEYLPGDLPAKVPAAGVVVLGALAHGLSRVIGAATQNVAVGLKLMLLLAIVGYGTWSMTSLEWQGESSSDPRDGPMILGFAQALVWISLSYSGFNAAVYLAGPLAQEADFLSVGSNDLTQYLLAVDRGNARVAALYQALHPAVLAALAHIIKAAHSEKKSVSICGELAGDPRAAPLLVAMGFDQLSMNAGSLSLVKRVLSAFSVAELADLMATLLPLRSAQEVMAALDTALSQRGLDIFLRRRGDD